jgi:peptide/nickel transport system permease protein
MIGTVIGVVILLLGIFGPVVFGDYAAQDLLLSHKPVGTEGAFFGTDALGRNLAARATFGIRISLVVAISVTALAVVLGTIIGLFAGFLRGTADNVISFVIDFIWGFPLILVAVLAAASIGSGLLPVIIAVGLVNTVAIARVVRGDFVVAARAGGYSTMRILFRHVLPNVVPVALVLSSYYVAVAIIAEAALSFVGLGAQPPLPSLGQMVSDGRNYLQLNHWESTIPGVLIFLMVLSVSLIGDGLRDLLDPRLRTAVERASAK